MSFANDHFMRFVNETETRLCLVASTTADGSGIHKTSGQLVAFERRWPTSVLWRRLLDTALFPFLVICEKEQRPLEEEKPIE